MKFQTAVFSIISLFFVSLISIWLGLYVRWVNYDNFMHFLGGVSVGMFALAIRTFIGKNYRATGIPWWYDFLFVVGFVMIIGVVWECYEFIQDQTIAHSLHWASVQSSVRDTLGDLIWDGIGALTSFYIFRKRQ